MNDQLINDEIMMNDQFGNWDFGFISSFWSLDFSRDGRDGELVEPFVNLDLIK